MRGTGSDGIYAVRLVDGARWEDADQVQKDGAFAIRELFEPAPFSGAPRRMLIERKVVEVTPGAVCEVGDLTPR